MKRQPLGLEQIKQVHIKKEPMDNSIRKAEQIAASPVTRRKAGLDPFQQAAGRAESRMDNMIHISKLAKLQQEKIMLHRTRGFEVVTNVHRHHSDTVIIMPKRSTAHAAAYDFFSNKKQTIYTGETAFFYTDVKAYMLPDEVLNITTRSGNGIKRGLILANQVGKIDSDYYSNPDNDGNIIIAIYNRSQMPQTIEAGDKIAQGEFSKYLTIDGDTATSSRTGGLGSTGN